MEPTHEWSTGVDLDREADVGGVTVHVEDCAAAERRGAGRRVDGAVRNSALEPHLAKAVERGVTRHVALELALRFSSVDHTEPEMGSRRGAVERAVAAAAGHGH